MAQIVKLRRSSVSGQKPTNSNLQLGELALNTADGKVFMAVSGSGGPSVQELIVTNTTNTGSISLTGDVTASYISGSFIGDGTGLYNVPASGVTGLQLNQISDGTVTASISEANGLQINTDTAITGTLSVSGEVYATASHAISASYAANALIVSGSNKYLYQTSPARTWSFQHDLGYKYPTINVFDENDNVIIPGGIHVIDSNYLEVYFADDVTGVVVATIGGNGSSGTSGTSGTSGSSGTSGTSGTSGSDGSSGTSGSSGSDGSSGTSGTSGSDGSSGTSGTSGSDGSSGTSGTSGTSFAWRGDWDSNTIYYLNDVVYFDGSSYKVIVSDVTGYQPYYTQFWTLLALAGTSGTSGTSGSDGSSGTSGTSGSDGSSGTSGTSGSDGSSGTSGTSGTDGTGGAVQYFTASDSWMSVHNLGTEYPQVTIWDENGNVVIPSQIHTIDENTIEISFPYAVAGYANISKGGHFVSGSVNYSNVGTDIVPALNNTYNLGSLEYQWKDIYVSTGSIYVGGVKVVSVNENNQVVIGTQVFNTTGTTGNTTTTITGLLTLEDHLTLVNTGSNVQSHIGIVSEVVSGSVGLVDLSPFNGANFDYIIKNGASMRGGNIASVWNGSSSSHNELNTTDLGDTSAVSFDITNTGTLNVAVTSGTWTVQVQYRALGDLV